jgi:spore maturation protein SpmB
MEAKKRERVWTLHESKDGAGTKKEIRDLADGLQMSELCAKLLYNRGFRTLEQAERFLKNEETQLHDPFLLKDADRAVERIRLSLERHEKTVIYGDYDVDGVTAVSVLYLYLKERGANVSYYIPSRNGEGYGLAVLVGNIGAIVGSIVSTRLMLRYTAKVFGKDADCECDTADETLDIRRYRKVRTGSVGTRLMGALLDGGKSGVDMGLSIIPGVLIICTLVMMLTNGMPEGGYTGSAYEGIGLLPWLGEKLQFILLPLFGFSNPEAISVPITALGAAGAAIGMAERLVAGGLANAHDVAVFTAMCMCWSGYLSTHVAMMDTLKCHFLTGKALLYHTIGGLCAGFVANWLYHLLSML